MQPHIKSVYRPYTPTCYYVLFYLFLHLRMYGFFMVYEIKTILLYSTKQTSPALKVFNRMSEPRWHAFWLGVSSPDGATVSTTLPNAAFGPNASIKLKPCWTRPCVTLSQPSALWDRAELWKPSQTIKFNVVRGHSIVM